MMTNFNFFNYDGFELIVQINPPTFLLHATSMQHDLADRLSHHPPLLSTRTLARLDNQSDCSSPKHKASRLIVSLQRPDSLLAPSD